MKAVIALGSNLGEREQTLASAISELRMFLEITSVSRFIESDPVGGVSQPQYLNAVVVAETEIAPTDLISKLLEIEERHGRTREVRWGARTLDLDLIVYGSIELQSKLLTLPHPRAHERAFVLGPWLEIDPDAFLPGFGAVRLLLKAT